jgi:hypothetical protein
MVALPENATTDIITAASAVLTDNWPIIAIILGIVLAFYIIARILRALFGGAEDIEDFNE